MVLSIGQFRPEKDHALQIRAMHCLLSAQPSLRGRVELVVMGSVRHQEDEALLQGLRELAAGLGLLDDGSVRFVANGSYAQLVEHMGRALVGVHTMWNEHFGISVVEMMAAGLVVIAHNSGGPKLDIIPHEGGIADLANGRCMYLIYVLFFVCGKWCFINIPAFCVCFLWSGYLAETPEEYASILEKVLLNYDDHFGMRERARKSADRYSDELFGKLFVADMEASLSYVWQCWRLELPFVKLK
jgi:alpha-1,2-mannosyltransferase